jgi:hypothetical protein
MRAPLRRFLFCACAVPILGPAVHAGTDLFKAFACEARLSYLAPAGNLADALRPAPGAGLRVATPYYGRSDAFLFLDIAGTEARSGSIPVRFGAVGLGLEWTGLPAYLPRPGAGAAMYEARIRAEDDPDGRFPFLHGGEAEFGSFASLRWERPLGRSALLSASARWDVIFTLPEYSQFFSASVGAGWQWTR